MDQLLFPKDTKALLVLATSVKMVSERIMNLTQSCICANFDLINLLLF